MLTVRLCLGASVLVLVLRAGVLLTTLSRSRVTATRRSQHTLLTYCLPETHLQTGGWVTCMGGAVESSLEHFQ